jgi:hypothetical protein
MILDDIVGERRDVATGHAASLFENPERVLSKNPIDAKTDCRCGRGLSSWIGRQTADDQRFW